MRNGLGLSLFLVTALIGTSGPTIGQVVLKLNGQPRQILEASGQGEVGEGFDLMKRLEAEKGTALETIFLPRFRVDTTDFSDTTLWSARSVDTGNVNLSVVYFTSSGATQATSEFTLSPREVVSVNIRDIPNLATTPSGVALGYVGFQYDGNLTFDSFQIDVSNDLATTQSFINPFVFCTNWDTRFFRFTASESSILSFFANGPLGANIGDPPTVTGTVYNEAGQQVTTFEIFAANISFVVDTGDIVPANLGAGTIVLRLHTVSTPRGFVSVEHRAGGKFSVSLDARCSDIVG